MNSGVVWYVATHGNQHGAALPVFVAAALVTMVIGAMIFALACLIGTDCSGLSRRVAEWAERIGVAMTVAGGLAALGYIGWELCTQ